MVAYNFQAQFAPAVEAGEKRQTIRANGKRRHARPGDAVQLYTGMRTKACRLLNTGRCTASTYCAIRSDGITLGNHPATHLDDFARADGFRNFAHMKDWFQATHGLPFIGTLIQWMPDARDPEGNCAAPRPSSVTGADTPTDNTDG